MHLKARYILILVLAEGLCLFHTSNAQVTKLQSYKALNIVKVSRTRTKQIKTYTNTNNNPLSTLFHLLSEYFHQRFQFCYSHHSFLNNILDLKKESVKSMTMYVYTCRWCCIWM